MGKTGVMGAFEELVLVALVRQGEDAFAVSIRQELEERTEATVVMGAVYATLDRLESKGMVRSRLGEDRPSRSGRARRYYRITEDGVEELRQTQEVRDRLWSGVDLDAATSAPGGKQ